MKKLNNLKWFSMGIAVCLLVTALVVPTFASTLSKTAQLVYNDIKITLNGGTVTPTDANGNTVEPFTIDGTTYLPVRAVANALGLGVSWDGATKTATLTSPTELISAPDAIFTTAADKNGYYEKLMYVTGVYQSARKDSNYDEIYINTSKGMLILTNDISQTSWDSLVVGKTYTFTFVYYDNNDAPIVPVGVYLYAK